jgi:hypothetical protein
MFLSPLSEIFTKVVYFSTQKFLWFFKIYLLYFYVLVLTLSFIALITVKHFYHILTANLESLSPTFYIWPSIRTDPVDFICLGNGPHFVISLHVSILLRLSILIMGCDDSENHDFPSQSSLSLLLIVIVVTVWWVTFQNLFFENLCSLSCAAMKASSCEAEWSANECRENLFLFSGWTSSCPGIRLGAFHLGRMPSTQTGPSPPSSASLEPQVRMYLSSSKCLWASPSSFLLLLTFLIGLLVLGVCKVKALICNCFQQIPFWG